MVRRVSGCRIVDDIVQSEMPFTLNSPTGDTAARSRNRDAGDAETPALQVATTPELEKGLPKVKRE